MKKYAGIVFGVAAMLIAAASALYGIAFMANFSLQYRLTSVQWSLGRKRLS